MVQISSEIPKCFKSFRGSFVVCVLMASEVITNLYTDTILMRRDVKFYFLM